MWWDLNDQYTRIEMSPNKLDMQVGDVGTITADVIHRYYTGEENQMCGCQEEEDPCEEEKIKANLTWKSADEDIVKILEVDSKKNKATVEAIGEGETYILARIAEAEDFGQALMELQMCQLVRLAMTRPSYS